VHSILSHCDERWDVAGDRIPLAARLAAVALGRLDEAGLDPHWLARARADGEEDESAESQPEFSPRGILMLAKALQEAGNLEGARATYQEILADPKPRTEAVDALLGLARLMPPAEVEGLVSKAVQLARELGPVSAALSGVEGGLLLARAQSPRAAETLSWASRAAQELGLTAAIAQTLVALARLQGQGLEQLPRTTEILLQPAHAGELAEVVDWLVPLALEHYARSPEARFGRILGALVASHSRTVLAVLDQLSPAARGSLVEICQNTKGIPSELAERLGSKAPQEAPEAASWLRIFFLGKFDVYRGGERIPENLWKTQKTKQLLGFLALRRQVSDDVAMEHFWPGDMVKGKRSLATALSMIRSALRREDGQEAPELFHRSQGMLALEAREVWHDVDEFESLYRQARAADEGGDTERAVAAYRRLVQIYRGPFMEGCYLDWALAERERLEQTAVDSMTRLAQLYQLQGRPRESAECAEKALLLVPESQDLHLLLMRAHMALGRPDQAVRQYEVCRKILDRDLGIEPSLALVEAYHRARLGLT